MCLKWNKADKKVFLKERHHAKNPLKKLWLTYLTDIQRSKSCTEGLFHRNKSSPKTRNRELGLRIRTRKKCQRRGCNVAHHVLSSKALETLFFSLNCIDIWFESFLRHKSSWRDSVFSSCMSSSVLTCLWSSQPKACFLWSSSLDILLHFFLSVCVCIRETTTAVFPDTVLWCTHYISVTAVQLQQMIPETTEVTEGHPPLMSFASL